MKKIFSSAEYLFSSMDEVKCPPNLGEMAIVGRSNVGKSSLINHLTQSSIAKISSKPGKTITLNVFLIDQAFCLVDLPGYGYAKVKKELKNNWSVAIDHYLNTSKNLFLLMQLIDSRHPPTSQDLEMYSWIQSKKIPTIIVLTKIDKLKKTEQKNIIDSYQKYFNCSIIPYSIKEPSSRILLKQEVQKHLRKRSWV